MGDVGHIDWTCKKCDARRFSCVECGQVCIVDCDSESELCDECFGRHKHRKDIAAIKAAARDVVAYDWSDNDADAVAAIERLRKAMKT